MGQTGSVSTQPAWQWPLAGFSAMKFGRMPWCSYRAIALPYTPFGG